MDQKIINEYARWKQLVTEDADLARELGEIDGKEDQIVDAFYRDLEFGTGGLRGVIGAGTNRMNVYTVAKASQGLADYVIKHFPAEQRRIAVSYDSRIKSDLFARTASGVFAANGIAVHIYPELMPTPCLSFAVRELHYPAGQALPFWRQTAPASFLPWELRAFSRPSSQWASALPLRPWRCSGIRPDLPRCYPC